MTTIKRFPYSGVYTPPKTSGGNPPNKQIPKKISGDYCFRAETKLYHDGEEAIRVTGYDKDFSIVKNVTDACEKLKKQRDGNVECSPTKLYFIGSHPKCYGKIDVDINLT